MYSVPYFVYLHVFVFNPNAIFYDKDRYFIKMFVIELMVNFIVYFCNFPSQQTSTH